jgi:photosystem II stability/assembly factor-like uncharacterized protein
VFYHTADGGITWVPSGPSEDFIGGATDFFFLNAQMGWAVIDFTFLGPGLLFTEDGGQTWVDRNVINGTSVYFTDSLKGWVTGGIDFKGIWYTQDGGISFEQQIGDTVPDLHDIAFVDDLTGWAVGNEGTILHTYDGGESWHYQESGTQADLYSLSFTENGYGWICGDSGVILHNNGIVNVEEIYQPNNSMTIYPNPTKESITIFFEFENETNIHISVNDINGKEIKSFSIGPKKAGNYSIDCGDFIPGIYLVSLKSEIGILSEKLIIE